MTALLELEQISKRFGGLQAVQDLSFSVHEGEILGLIGPNGAGKSTLFNLINGVFAPNTGRIVFGGDRHHRRRSPIGSPATASPAPIRSCSR